MAFFGNNAVNYLNLHYGIHSIALGGGGAFFMVYLLDSGVPVPAVFVSLAAILLGRFIVRPLVIGLSARFGLRAMVAAGTLMSAVQYPLLAEVHGVGPALYWLIAASAVSDTVYWPTYHAYFAALGDDEHRGQQIGMREAIAAVVGVVSPLVTGWLLVTFGPRVAFGTTAVILVFAALPFLRTPDVKVAPQSIGSLRAALPGALLFAADGWIAASYVFVWQIALFLSLHESLLGFGGALAVAALVGAVGGLLLGRHIDRGHGKRAVWYAFGPLAHRGRAARARGRQRAVRRDRERARLAHRLPLHADADDVDLHPGEARALHAALPRRRRRRLGRRRRQRAPPRRAAQHARRAAMGRNPAGAVRHRREWPRCCADTTRARVW